MNSLYPAKIRATEINLGRVVSGFSPIIIIIFLMDHFVLTAVLIFLSSIYLVQLLKKGKFTKMEEAERDYLI